MKLQDQSICELLAMVIFADKQVYASEIKAFIAAVLELQKQGVLKTDLTETRALLWYETHKSDLMETMVTPDFEVWLQNKLGSLSSLKEKEKILRAMELISRSDDDEHVSEQALRVLAKKHWKMAG